VALGLDGLHHGEVPGACRDEAFGQVEGPVRVPDVLRQHEDRIRRPEVQQLGPAGTDLAEADLAFAGPEDPAEAVVQAGKQRAAAVVVDFQRRGGSGSAAQAHRQGRDVFLQVGDGFSLANQDRLPQPALGAGLHADAGVLLRFANP
jgi:hypothetical protein